MATQVLYPDALITQTGLTGAVTAIDDDADTSASDTDYLSSNGATVCTMVASFPTPSANPSGTQTVKFRLRQVNDPSGTQYVTIQLRDGTTVMESWSIGLSGTSFQTYSGEFDAGSLDTVDGSGVNVYISGGYAGTPPANRWSWEISALEWDAELSEGATSVNVEAAPIAGASLLAGSAVLAVERAASPLIAAGSLLGTATVAAGVQVQAPPLIGSGGIAGSAQIAANVEAEAIDAAGSLSGSSRVAAGVIAQAILASLSLDGDQAIGVGAEGLPIASEGALDGLLVRGALIDAAPILGGLSLLGSPVTPGGYATGYYCAITLSAGLSPSNLDDYTAWITAESVSAEALTSIQAHARGDLNDVRFSTDSAGADLLAHFKLHAAPGSSEWVFLVGPVDYVGGTAKTIYMHWGDATLTTDESSPAVFPSNVVAAWSPRDTGTLEDLSGNGHTLVAVGTIGTDASHPSGAPAFKPDSLNAYLQTTGQDFGGICDTQSCSIETLGKHYSDNSGWMASVANPAVTGYWGQYYAVTGQVYYEISRPGGSVATTTPITAGQSSAWAYWGSVYNDAAAQVSGRLFGVPLAPVTVPAINTTMTDAALLQNTGTLNALNAAVALAIVRNVALSADWMAASDRLANAQDTYVSYSASVSAHGQAPTDVEIQAVPVEGAGSLSGTPTLGVLLEAQAIAAAGAAGGAHILSVLKAAPAIAGAGALSGTEQISALVAADPLAAAGAVLGGHVVSARITATAVTATGAVVGQVQAGAGVLISGDPVAAAGSLAGLEVLSVRQSAAAIGAAGILSGYVGLAVRGGPVEAGGTVLGEQLVEYVVSGDPISAQTELGGRLVLSVLQAADALLAVGAVEGVVLATGSALDDITGAQAYLLDQGRQARVLDTGVDAFIVRIDLDAVVIH